VLIAMFVLVALDSALSGPESAEQEIGEQVWGTGCMTVVSTNERVVRRWPQASKAELITCETSDDENDSEGFVNHAMDYAQYESPAPLSAMLKTSPPDGTYCTIGSAVVALDDLQDAFRAMCAQRGGTLHDGAAG
jgi:hypothetical protein